MKIEERREEQKIKKFRMKKGINKEKKEKGRFMGSMWSEKKLEIIDEGKIEGSEREERVLENIKEKKLKKVLKDKYRKGIDKKNEMV